MTKIQVSRVDTGEKVWIPAHWMKHPQLSLPFRELPSARAAEASAADQTSESAASATPPTPNSTASRGSNKSKE